MAAKKDLSLSKVKSTSKKIDKMEKYEIDEGVYAGETVSFYPTFSDDRIENLLKEFQKLLLEADEKGIELSDEMNIHLLNMLMIKHFSHFHNAIPSSLLGEGKKEGFLDYLDHFRKTGLYVLFMDTIFLPSEINKVHNSMTDFISKSLLTDHLSADVNRKLEALRFKYADAFNQVENMDTKPLS